MKYAVPYPISRSHDMVFYQSSNETAAVDMHMHMKWISLNNNQDNPNNTLLRGGESAV
jgi:hypothetical protein